MSLPRQNGANAQNPGLWVCPQVVGKPLLLVPVVAGARVRGRGCSGGRARRALLNHGASFLWRPRLLPQAFPVPGCGLPCSHPYTLFLHSQRQSSTRVCSPNPTFQPPAPIHTSRPTLQAGVHGAVAHTIRVGLTLSCLPPTSCCMLLQAPRGPFWPCWSPCWWGGFPRCGTFSFPSAPHPSPGVQVLCCFLSFLCLAPPVGILFVLQVSKVLCWLSAGTLWELFHS